MSKAYRNISLCGWVLLLATVPGSWMVQGFAQTTHTASSARHRSHDEKLDVNAATAEQLQSVPGITPIYAKRIVAGRPYTTKRQLLTHGILSASVYSQVKDELVAHRKKK